jgi:glyoxylase-like metal-dependent hydrolase (beta-lactamase superfamily II)
MPALVSGQLDQVQPGVQRLVANNAGYMTGPGTNTYLIGHSEFFVLDPGPLDEIHLDRILTVTRGRVRAVLATHTHQDHSPAARVLAANTGAEILGRTPPDDGRQDTTFSPTRALQDNDMLAIEGLRLRALHTPGHASNHLCFLLENSGLLFTGDHLMQGSTVVIMPPDGDMNAYLQSLRRLQAEPVTALAPGHGLVVNDAQAEIAGVIAHRLKREAKVIARLREAGATTTLALVSAVYDDVDSRLHALARYSLLAHLIKLRDERKVLQQGDEPAAVWQWAESSAGSQA